MGREEGQQSNCAVSHLRQWTGGVPRLKSSQLGLQHFLDESGARPRWLRRARFGCSSPPPTRDRNPTLNRRGRRQLFRSRIGRVCRCCTTTPNAAAGGGEPVKAFYSVREVSHDAENQCAHFPCQPIQVVLKVWALFVLPARRGSRRAVASARCEAMEAPEKVSKKGRDKEKRDGTTAEDDGPAVIIHEVVGMCHK